ncbi:MAG TPA: glycosyltransferase family 1 protein [Armatimonadetes bacterium]|nr:glycosyltransferase family 1 protein [Armatimonadota bacterium]
MLEGRDIILFSSDDYECGLTTSKHQLTKRLAGHNRVLFVESIGLRRPRATKRDLGRILRKLVSFCRFYRRIDEHLIVYTPLVLPFHDLPTVRWLNRLLLSATLRFVCRWLRFRRPLLWIFLPTAADLVGQFGEECVIYYNVDDFAQFTGSDVKTITALDEQLTRTADIVFTSARNLYQRKRPLNPNTHYLPHGVEVEHFARALGESLPRPSDIAAIPPPIIGYYGFIGDYFDTDLVAGIADARPQWSVVLIGESRLDLSDLTARPNVYWLGPKPYEELPAYAAAFDVALLARKLNPLTRSMNPLKLREYLAAGRPVVSVPMPEVVSAYGDLVYIADDAPGFVAAIEEILATDTPAARRHRAAAVASESWEAKLERISRLIEETLRHRRG